MEELSSKVWNVYMNSKVANLHHLSLSPSKENIFHDFQKSDSNQSTR